MCRCKQNRNSIGTLNACILILSEFVEHDNKNKNRGKYDSTKDGDEILFNDINIDTTHILATCLCIHMNRERSQYMEEQITEDLATK